MVREEQIPLHRDIFKFVTCDPEESKFGIDIDIIFSNKRIIIKNARIEWIKSPNQNGTFHAANIESYEMV